MHAKAPWAALVELGVAVAAIEDRYRTDRPRTARRGGPSFGSRLAIGLSAGFMIFGFQNCAVDLTNTTPGASTSGACSPTANQLLTIDPAITVLKTNCAGCHASSNGGAGGFLVPESTADQSQSSVKAFAFGFLCGAGGEAVGLKIDGSNAHGGGTFPRSGPASPLFDYLTTTF
jgi:hypothetical protein